MPHTETTVRPEQDEWRETAHIIAREIWRTEYRAKNPEATKEDIAADWSEVVSEYRNMIKMALKRLGKNKGIVFSKSK